MSLDSTPPGFQDMQTFGLIDALLGRRSRRFSMGAELPDGVFAHRSRSAPTPLSELEKYLVVAACGGNTSWHFMHFRGQRYAPHLANYSGAAGGRTFPSSAGFETSKTFFTDDTGVYLLEMRDSPAFAERAADGSLDLADFVAHVRGRVRKLEEGRLGFPAELPYTEAHNTWVANKPSTLLVIPVGDLSLHFLQGICYMVQNGIVLYDDINRRSIHGIEQYSDLVDAGSTWPITFAEQTALDRDLGRAGHELLRGSADAPGHGPGRVDVQRTGPLRHPRCQRRPGRARPGLSLRQR